MTTRMSQAAVMRLSVASVKILVMNWHSWHQLTKSLKARIAELEHPTQAVMQCTPREVPAPQAWHCVRKGGW